MRSILSVNDTLNI